MRKDTDILQLDLRHPPSRKEDLRLADVEAVRLVLRGGSPIDWHRLQYRTLDEVNDFLRANLLDPDDPRDMARLAYLHREALRYLRRNFAFRFPPEVEEPEDTRDIFLYASEAGRLNRVQILACVVLKAMHTINHLEARELLQETAISEAELIQVVEAQILRRADAVTAQGLPVVHFFGSRKGRDSMVSKLLSKKAARAGDILDRVRFRIVTETQDDVIPVLSHLVNHVFPWNQITAGESTNKLISFHQWLQQDPRLREYLPQLQVDIGPDEQAAGVAPGANAFSGASYRMVNFILDVPVRLDHLLGKRGDPWLLQRGSIVYVACEFQVLDQETAFLNEQGENSHENYKRRQRERVGERLMWGLLKERRSKGDGRPARSSQVARRPTSRSALEMDTGSFQAVGSPRPRRPVRRPQLDPPPRPAPRASGGDGAFSFARESARPVVFPPFESEEDALFDSGLEGGTFGETDGGR